MVEERLRTRSITSALAVAALVVVAVELVAVTVAVHRVPWFVWLILAAVLVIMVAAIAAFATVIVRVLDAATGRSLELVYGPRGVLRQRFAPAQIEGARAQRLSIVQLGGWGYRGSLRLMKFAAVATRGGDALQVQLSGGRRFYVTVDEPQAFVDGLFPNGPR